MLLITKFLHFFILLFLCGQILVAQEPLLPHTFNFGKAELEAHLRYLASDELGGRRTTSAGGALAADYIAKQFALFGVKPAPGQAGFFQPIPFRELAPPVLGTLKMKGIEFKQGDNLLIINGRAVNFSKDAVFAGHGWVDEATGVNDYKNLDVKGKVVFVLPGKPDSQSPFEVFNAMPVKQKLAAEHGAVALLELYRLNFPWQFFKNYFGKPRTEIDESVGEDSSGLVYGWLKEVVPNPVTEIEAGQQLTVELSTSGVLAKPLSADNVVGIIPGIDSLLKNEYILLSAHYDHVGIGKQGGAPFTPQDSIFNGARDNGMGTVALLAAARDLAARPGKRSVILLACTGEEMGMLGSAWYADHPLVPLEQTVFNFNNDGAGYNSTAHVNVIGWGRTNTNNDIETAAKSVGLSVLDDPAPEQNLFERSDNISFARKGVPAIDFSPGITEMNQDVFKFYHQAADNPDSIDYDYLYRFCQVYSLAARQIVDKTDKPAWVPGDKFERH
jgi:hypothetical protein